MVASACGEPVRNRPHPNGAGSRVDDGPRTPMRPASRTDRTARRVAGVLVASGLALVGSFAAATVAGADTDSPPALAVVLDGRGAAFDGAVEITCESPAVADAHGVEIGSAVRSTRDNFSVPTGGTSTLTIADLTAGSACSVTATGPTAADLGAVDGGTPLVGADGQLRGVAVTVDRGTTATAHLTYTIPFAIASSRSHTEAHTTTAAGSGSAASTPPPLPGSDRAASAAAPVALAAARSTTTAPSAALPDTSGSGTTPVLASIGVLLCGAAAYVLVLRDRKEPHIHD